MLETGCKTFDPDSLRFAYSTPGHRRRTAGARRSEEGTGPSRAAAGARRSRGCDVGLGGWARGRRAREHGAARARFRARGGHRDSRRDGRPRASVDRRRGPFDVRRRPGDGLDRRCDVPHPSPRARAAVRRCALTRMALAPVASGDPSAVAFAMGPERAAKCAAQVLAPGRKGVPRVVLERVGAELWDAGVGRAVAADRAWLIAVAASEENPGPTNDARSIQPHSI